MNSDIVETGRSERRGGLPSFLILFRGDVGSDNKDFHQQ